MADQSKEAAYYNKLTTFSSDFQGVVFNGVNASSSKDATPSTATSRAFVGVKHLLNRYNKIRVWAEAEATGYYRSSRTPQLPGTTTNTPAPPFLDKSITGYQVNDPSVTDGPREINPETFLGVADKDGTIRLLIPSEGSLPHELELYPEVLEWLGTLHPSMPERLKELYSLTGSDFKYESKLLANQPIAGTVAGGPVRGTLTGRYGIGANGEEHYEFRSARGGLGDVQTKAFKGKVGHTGPDDPYILVEQPGGYVTFMGPEDKPVSAHHSIRAAIEFDPADAGPDRSKKDVLADMDAKDTAPWSDPEYKGIVIDGVEKGTTSKAVNGVWTHEATEVKFDGKVLTGRYHKSIGRAVDDEHAGERIFVEIEGENPPHNWVDLSAFTGKLVKKGGAYGARYRDGEIVELLGNHPAKNLLQGMGQAGAENPEDQLAF